MSSVKSNKVFSVTHSGSKDESLLKQFGNELHGRKALKRLLVTTFPTDAASIYVYPPPAHSEINGGRYYASGTRVNIACPANVSDYVFQGWLDTKDSWRKFESISTDYLGNILSLGDTSRFWYDNYQAWTGLLDSRSYRAISFEMNDDYDLHAVYWSGIFAGQGKLFTDFSGFYYNGQGFLGYKIWNHAYDTGAYPGDWNGIATGEKFQFVAANTEILTTGNSHFPYVFYRSKYLLDSSGYIMNQYDREYWSAFANNATGTYSTDGDHIHVEPVVPLYSSGQIINSGIIFGGFSSGLYETFEAYPTGTITDTIGSGDFNYLQFITV